MQIYEFVKISQEFQKHEKVHIQQIKILFVVLKMLTQILYVDDHVNIALAQNESVSLGRAQKVIS